MPRRRIVGLVVAAILASRASAQDPTPGADLPTDGRSPIPNSTHRFIGIPILRSAPATGFGGGVGFARLFPSGDTALPPSAIGIGGVYAFNRSWAYGLGGTTSRARDRWRDLGGAAGYALRYDFFGAGAAAGDAGRSVRVLQQGDAEVLEVTRRVVRDLYIGPRYKRAHFFTRLDQDESLGSVASMVRRDAVYLTSAAGATIAYDTRDAETGPTRGTLLHGNAMFARDVLVGRSNYNGYDLSVDQFISLGHSVLAMRAALCDVTKGASVWELCLYGSGSDLRGYLAGRYRDNALGAIQAEWRVPVWHRIGAVAFAGTGGVSSSLTDRTGSVLLSSGGIGVRYLVWKSLNVGADGAWGKNGGAFYLRMGDAF